MPDAGIPPDQEARNRIAEDLGTTLFVEAGAGTGKTTALVDRLLALVMGGEAELEAIAAITFTDKAAAELRARVRRQLEERLVANPDEVAQARCAVALGQLDGAAIGTLHSFAQRLLSEHPVEAGLPPRVEVLDEVSSAVAFERRWRGFRDELLADPALERSILLLVASGVRMSAIQALAVAFNDNWDMVEERVADDETEPPTVRALAEPVMDAIASVCREPCRDPADKLRVRLDEIAAWVAGLRAIYDELELLEALADEKGRPSFKVGGSGKRVNFDTDVTSLRADVRDAGERLDAVCSAITCACVIRLAVAIRRFTLDSAEERRRAGQLEFHDLLVMARALLRDPEHGAAVRARLHARYQRLLLDEFQDTDPIQIELAVRIAAADPTGAPAGQAPWGEVTVTPGHLFLVGDPKQSIYRFRRADISTFLDAASRFGENSGRVELTTNFRTVTPVIDWVNHTFDALMGEPNDVEAPVPSQPTYLALDPVRSTPAVGPPIAVIGRTEQPGSLLASDLRTAEAADVASTVARAICEQWTVADGTGGWRPARLGDITVLLPARTSLPYLEDALDTAGIAYRAETSSLVYVSRAIRDFLMVLRAVDDPTNYLHVVSALRTPLLACGDDDLFRFKWERRGRWSYLAEQPETVPDDDLVRHGLRYLRSLYDQRHWLAPSELLDRIARDRRVMELGFAEGRPRDVWRRLRFVIDQARAWSDATGGNLRQYLAWVAQQTAEGARVAESVLPETDDDAIRIMTIHGAKGLEFPITIVSGMSTAPTARRAPVEAVFPPRGTVGYRLGSQVTTSEYEAWAPVDEQMGLHERIRLLYVACTRARDHLVVSLYRKERAGAPTLPKRTSAELLLDGMGSLIDEVPDAVEATGTIPLVPVTPPSPPPPFEAWAAERNAALVHAERPTTVAATALTEEGAPDVEGEPDPGLKKRPRDLDLPAWLKGRYGSAVGRAVHGALQTIDLATGDGLETAVASQCEAEAIPDRADDVRALVAAALGSPSVREAAAGPHWREVYACAPVDGRLLEGYIDLLYRGPDGLVVVDYKTSGTSDPQELERRAEGYRIQGASYAVSLEVATDEPITRVTFVFLTPDGVVESHLPMLDSAKADVRRLVTSGTESTTD